MTAVELRGSGRTYRIDLASTNAKCRIEEETGLSYYDVVAALASGTPKVSLVRQVFKAGLLDPATPTIEDAGAILDDVAGGVEMVLQAFRGIRIGPSPPPKKKRATRGR